ncbi:hypothetical protein ACOME3_009305 [Neoechinorhynchus agilis]
MFCRRNAPAESLRQSIDQVLLRGTKRPECLDVKRNQVMISPLRSCETDAGSLRFNSGELYVAGYECGIPKKANTVTPSGLRPSSRQKLLGSRMLGAFTVFKARLRIAFISACSEYVSPYCRQTRPWRPNDSKVDPPKVPGTVTDLSSQLRV